MHYKNKSSLFSALCLFTTVLIMFPFWSKSLFTKKKKAWFLAWKKSNVNKKWGDKHIPSNDLKFDALCRKDKPTVAYQYCHKEDDPKQGPPLSILALFYLKESYTYTWNKPSIKIKSFLCFINSFPRMWFKKRHQTYNIKRGCFIQCPCAPQNQHNESFSRCYWG